MLTLLTISNFAIVDTLELDLRHGMTVVSGETGAGKSIMLDALGLALGDRSDSDTVRGGAERAEITASFDISQIPDAQQWLEQNDLDSDQECILKRVITREGRSRSYINGQPAPLAMIKALGSHLVDIHGQHEHQRLLKKDHHRTLLDDFAGQQKQATRVHQQFKQWQKQAKELKQLTEQNEAQLARVQLLSYQIEELDALQLVEGELTELETEQKQLANAHEILQTGHHISALTSEREQDNCLSLIRQCQHLIDTLSQHAPKAVTPIAEMLSSAQIQLEEADNELRHYLSSVELNPERQQYVEERLSTLYDTARKHRVKPEELLGFQQQLQSELDGLQRSDEELDQLALNVEQAQQTYQASAEKLSKARTLAAKKLSKAVDKQLHSLGMLAAHFEVALTTLEPEQQVGNGLEEIEFMIAANKGQTARPLAKVASGGELSRISLAIQVITAQTSSTPTLIFDEVDVGIGGAIAEVVGRLLSELGKRTQILCVTHQPQVASQGHQHLFVSKKARRNQTQTQVTHLSPDQRIQEVARMLGGIDITERSVAHAQEMLSNCYH